MAQVRWRRCAEPFGQRLDLVTVEMPDGYFRRQVLENALASGSTGKYPRSRFAPSLTFARRKPLHQPYGRAKSQAIC